MEITGREVTYKNLSNRTRRELALKYKNEIIDYMEEDLEYKFIKEVEKRIESEFGEARLFDIDYNLELNENDFVKMSIMTNSEVLLQKIGSKLYPYVRNGHVGVDFDIIANDFHVNLTYCDGLIDRERVLEVIDEDIDFLVDILDKIETDAHEIGYELLHIDKDFEELANKYFNDNGYTFIVEPVLTKF